MHLSFKKNNFIYLFLAVQDFHYWVRFFSGCGEWGLLSSAVHRLLIEVASLGADHRLLVHRLQQLLHVGLAVEVPRLYSRGLRVVAPKLSCSTACGILPDQG